MEALEEQTMVLADYELQWAWELKHAVEERASPHHSDNSLLLVPLTDFEYAQHALVAQGDIEEALERVEKMQCFREEYGLVDNAEEGMSILQLFTQQQRWFMVSVDYAPHHGHFIAVYDYACLFPSRVDMPDDWRIFLGGLYYIFQLCQCNVQACRQGMVHICECQGMGQKNFLSALYSRMWYHLVEHYPVIAKECSWLHTPLVGNLQHALFKTLMGARADIIRVGCHFDGYDGRIDEMFKTPTLEAAEQRLMSRYMAYLKIRYYHQEIFRLPERSIPAEVVHNDSLQAVEQQQEPEGAGEPPERGQPVEAPPPLVLPQQAQIPPLDLVEPPPPHPLFPQPPQNND